MSPSADQRITDNPFYVLDLAPSASRVEVERAGQRLQAMLELGLSAAAEYQTPLGPRQRTRDKVRWALAELRDPERRLGHELWARGRANGAVEVGVRRREPAPIGPFANALHLLGWRRP